MCMTNREYFKKVGDVASANKFEQMAVHAKKDLDSVRFAFKRGDPVPKFHYETRAFSRVVSNTDLTDNDLELRFVNLFLTPCTLTFSISASSMGSIMSSRIPRMLTLISNGSFPIPEMLLPLIKQPW